MKLERDTIASLRKEEFYKLIHKNGKWWAGGRISWDRNSTFSKGRNYDHEIEIAIFYEIEIMITRSKVRLG